jgi:integrase
MIYYFTKSLELSGQCYRNFLYSIRSEQTRMQYLYGLKRFMLYTKSKSLDDLLTIDPKMVEANIIDWIVKLREEHKLSRSVINHYLSAMLKFYLMNDVLLNRKKIGSYLGPCEFKYEDRPYTHQEIARLLAYSDERMKVIVLLLASTGMRIGALPELCLRNLEKIEHGEYQLYKIVVYEKSKERYTTFCTPECAAAIDSYLQYRQRFGERMDPDIPLLRRRFHHDQIINVKNARRLARRTLPIRLSELLIRSGIVVQKHQIENAGVVVGDPAGPGRERKEVRRCNGFRKFANTQMAKAKVDPVIKSMLLGHDVGLQENYFRPSEEELLAEYIKAVDFLTINEEQKLKLKVKQMEEEMVDAAAVADLKNQLDKKEGRLVVMEKQFNTMQSQMQALLTAIGNMKGDQDKVYEFSKTLFDSGILKTTTQSPSS